MLKQNCLSDGSGFLGWRMRVQPVYSNPDFSAQLRPLSPIQQAKMANSANSSPNSEKNRDIGHQKVQGGLKNNDKTSVRYRPKTDAFVIL